jgi:hypothetical protein
MLVKENNMNFLREIKNILDENDMIDNCVKVSIWTDEMAVYLWDKEVGISVIFDNPGDKQVYFDTEGLDFELNTQEMKIISQVMEILVDNLDEIKALTK